MDTAELLMDLCALPGPSGFESAAAERFRELLAPFVDETITDAFGNVTGVRRCGREGAGKLMIDAHIDGIGFIVTGICEGFLRFSTLGRIDERLLPASEVAVLTEPPLRGIICAMPPHLIKKEDSEKSAAADDLFIDIGLNQDEAAAAVPLGTSAVFRGGARRLGEGFICGKTLDNRAGAAAVLLAAQMLKDAELDCDMYFCASAQEEVGTRGAAVASYNAAPGCCIVIDADFAYAPDMDISLSHCELGGGVVISRGPNMNRDLTDEIMKVALDKSIDHQTAVEPGDSGTNARAIQISRGGVATALLGIPLRYMHSPNETVSLHDIGCAAKLIVETAKTLKIG